MASSKKTARDHNSSHKFGRDDAAEAQNQEHKEALLKAELKELKVATKKQERTNQHLYKEIEREKDLEQQLLRSFPQSSNAHRGDHRLPAQGYVGKRRPSARNCEENHECTTRGCRVISDDDFER